MVVVVVGDQEGAEILRRDTGAHQLGGGAPAGVDQDVLAFMRDQQRRALALGQRRGAAGSKET